MLLPSRPCHSDDFRSFAPSAFACTEYPVFFPIFVTSPNSTSPVVLCASSPLPSFFCAADGSVFVQDVGFRAKVVFGGQVCGSFGAPRSGEGLEGEDAAKDGPAEGNVGDVDGGGRFGDVPVEVIEGAIR